MKNKDQKLPSPSPILATGESGPAPAAPKVKAPGILKLEGDGKPRVKVTGPGSTAAALLLILLSAFHFQLSAFAQPGILPQPGTQSSVFTNRLLTHLDGGLVTNRLWWTNGAVRPAFGNTNAIHIHTNAASGRWEWRTAFGTVAATNDSNRPTGTWHVAGAGAALYGDSRYEPRSPQTIAGGPAAATPPNYVTVDEDGVIVSPTNFAAANNLGGTNGGSNPNALTNNHSVAVRFNGGTQTLRNSGGVATLVMERQGQGTNAFSSSAGLEFDLGADLNPEMSLSASGLNVVSDVSTFGTFHGNGAGLTNVAASTGATFATNSPDGRDLYFGINSGRHMNLENVPWTTARLQSHLPLRVVTFSDTALIASDDTFGLVQRALLGRYMPPNSSLRAYGGIYPLTSSGAVTYVGFSPGNTFFIGGWIGLSNNCTVTANWTAPMTTAEVCYWVGNGFTTWYLRTNPATAPILTVDANNGGAITPAWTNVYFPRTACSLYLSNSSGTNIIYRLGGYDTNVDAGFVYDGFGGGSFQMGDLFANANNSNAFRLFFKSYDTLMVADFGPVENSYANFKNSMVQNSFTADRIWLAQQPQTNDVTITANMRSNYTVIGNATGDAVVDAGALYRQIDVNRSIPYYYDSIHLTVLGASLASYQSSPALPWNASKLDAYGYSLRIPKMQTDGIGSLTAGSAVTISNTLNMGYTSTRAQIADKSMLVPSPVNTGDQFISLYAGNNNHGIGVGIIDSQVGGYWFSDAAVILAKAGSPATSHARFDMANNTNTFWGGIYSPQFVGGGANLTSLNADNISAGTINEARLPDNATVTGWNLGNSTASQINAAEAYLTNVTITIPTSLAADDTSKGTYLSGLNNSGGVTQWDAVYLNGSSQWVLADADGSGTFPALGLVTATVSTGNATTVITYGSVRNDAWSWTPGGNVYLSTAAGGLTQTAPASSGNKVQVIGVALTADILYVRPSADYGTAP